MKTLSFFVLLPLLVVSSSFGQNRTREEFIRTEHEARARFLDKKRQSLEKFQQGVFEKTSQSVQKNYQTEETSLLDLQTKCNKDQFCEQTKPPQSECSQNPVQASTMGILKQASNQFVGRAANRRMWVDGYVVTSGFGMRRLPGERAPRMHNGVDLGTPIGVQILAPFDGTLIQERTSRGGGITARFVGDNNGVELLFLHLRSSQPNRRYVRQGEIIAHTGNTGVLPNGRRVRPHLHITMRVNGKVVDPLLYIVAETSPSSNSDNKLRLTFVEKTSKIAQQQNYKK